jgi:hypothetical protein
MSGFEVRWPKPNLAYGWMVKNGLSLCVNPRVLYKYNNNYSKRFSIWSAYYETILASIAITAHQLDSLSEYNGPRILLSFFQKNKLKTLMGFFLLFDKEKALTCCLDSQQTLLA